MIIVNFATEHYRRGQQRLVASLKGHKALIFHDYPPGSPSHQASPYEFKIHAMKKASEQDKVVLWADASMWLDGDLSKIENIILERGYYMEEAGHMVDTWTNDFTRKYFELPLGSGYSMFSAGLLGIDFNNSQALTWFNKWAASAKAGCFKGDWSNHRHDMTCGSIIASQMGFQYVKGGTHLCYVGPGYSEPGPECVFKCQGVL